MTAFEGDSGGESPSAGTGSSDCAAEPVVCFTSLTFSGGVEVPLGSTGVVALVGPNNVGKSTALAELQEFLRSEKFEFNGRVNRVFVGGNLQTAQEPTFSDWFEEFADELLPDPVYRPELRTYRNWATTMTELQSNWLNRFHEPNGRGNMAHFLMSSGMSAAFEGPTPNFYGSGSPMMGTPNRQFEQLYFEEEVESRICELSRRVFGEPVALFRPGSQSVLHWGLLPDIEGLNPNEQRAALLATPKVSEQGTGVQALLNLAITLELGREPIVVLDEPDAHLHPPQAKAAGRFVGARGRRSQVFIATHSVEFLLGVVDAGVDVTVIRLDRTGARPYASVLSASQLRRSWDEVVVRYSGVLAGLMHRGVVLCEAEADCRYFEVAVDHLTAGRDPHDLRFVQAGGKAGVRKLLTVLDTMSVPVAVVCDFDALNDWSEIERLYRLLGGDPSEIEADWRATNDLLRSQGDQRSISQVGLEIEDALAKLTADGHTAFDGTVRKAVGDVLKSRDGWANAKRLGVAAVRGPNRTRAERLLSQLRTRGLHVLPWGELEGLHPEVNTNLHGPAWVTHALEQRLYETLPRDRAEWISEIPKLLGGGTVTRDDAARDSEPGSAD